MNNDKLHQITHELYQSGIEKGKAEAAKIIDEAKKKAEEILAQAKKNANEIENTAKENADKMLSNVKSDLLSQFDFIVNGIKEKVSLKITETYINENLDKPHHLVETILNAFVDNVYKTDNLNTDLTLMLPKNWEQLFNTSLVNKITESIQKGLTINSSNDLNFNIEIINTNDNFKIVFNEDELRQFFIGRLNQFTKKVLGFDA
ncbi:MAG: hypothetical protein ACK4K9_07680 [Bacteroidia bacterium]